MTQSTAPLTGAPSAGALNAEEIAAIRADFPYLERPARNGQALAYLDWAATSQKPAGVITTEADFYRMSNGAAGRSTYQLADEATATFEDARDAIAAFVGARGSELVFTKNATEAINLVALAMRAGVTATQLRDGIWTHPSSTEALNEVLATLPTGR